VQASGKFNKNPFPKKGFFDQGMAQTQEDPDQQGIAPG